MNVWDYNLTKLRAQPNFERFRLERLLNYGMDGEKITRDELKKYWNQIKIPKETREFLKMFIDKPV